MRYVLPYENRLLRTKYRITSFFYDLLDYPWERRYRKWRPSLLQDLSGWVIEVGVGTGQNLLHYPPHTQVIGVDLSPEMLKRALRRSRLAPCAFYPVCEDATTLASLPSDSFDWLIATFLCCVMPDPLKPLALDQFARVLKPGGRFRLLEMIYSNHPKIRKRQERFAPFVQKVYGARFDRNTLAYLEQSPALKITQTRFLKDDVYLLIEGFRL